MHHAIMHIGELQPMADVPILHSVGCDARKQQQMYYTTFFSLFFVAVAATTDYISIHFEFLFERLTSRRNWIKFQLFEVAKG